MYDPELAPPSSDQILHSPTAGATADPIHVLRRSEAVAELIADPGWTLIEEGFTLAREHEVESLFTIANGYVGNRGSLAEGSPLSAPATFVAGVFEIEKPGAVPGYLVCPDWTGIRAWIEEQPLSMDQGETLAHRRLLDMRRGLLWREWRHRDINGRITRIASFRLASLADRHLLAQSMVIMPENYSGAIRLESSIELQPQVQASPPPDEWKTRRDATRVNVLPLALRSPGTDITVAFGAASQLTAPGNNACRREIDITERRITERFHFDAEIGSEYRLDRFVSIYTSRDCPQPMEDAVAQVNRVLPAGLRNAVNAHQAAWHTRWRNADVEVEGDEFLQKALRFAEYHLISSANPEDPRVSIGARALSGESYKGHVFWDTEIYMVPFYSFTHPPSARALLAYRYYTLPAAREKARAANYRGAMYPWESADTGEETTPPFVIAFDGKVVPVLNGSLEIHITADIAYAVWQYWLATGDDDFLLHAGAEILLETARFWASRGQIEADGRYHIRHVIGPDEYHEDVDDSAFTNLMAAWNMRRGVDTARIFAERWPEAWQRLAHETGVTRQELETWQRLADAMYIPFDPRTLLFEQFQGFYRKEHVDLQAYEPRTAAMDVILGHDRIQEVDVVKQADVVMAMYLLWEQFSPEVRAANFRYYEPLTGHGSSLSPSIHALLAARFGHPQTAEAYLKQAAEIDLGNNMGNAAGGVHAAAIGGLWQAMVFGFGGVHLQQDGLLLDPHLLPQWRRLSFPLEFRGRRIRITLMPDQVAVAMETGREALRIGLAGSAEIQAQPHHQYLAERRDGHWGQWREHGAVAAKGE